MIVVSGTPRGFYIWFAAFVPAEALVSSITVPRRLGGSGKQCRTRRAVAGGLGYLCSEELPFTD